MSLLTKLKALGVQTLSVQNHEATAVNPYEPVIWNYNPVREINNPDWQEFKNLNLPPLPCPSVPDGTYEIDRFKEEYQISPKGENDWDECNSGTYDMYQYAKGGQFETRIILVLSEPVAESAPIKLNDNEVEYRSQKHEMWVEGTADEKPTHDAIINHAKSKGYSVINIGIWHDDLQGFWRFNGDIKPLNEVAEKPKSESPTDGYLETLKADLSNAIELQEQEINEEMNRGREEALNYAIEMYLKHYPTPPEAEPVESAEEMKQLNFDDLWDDYSERIDHDIDSLQYFAGRDVITKESFKKLFAKVEEYASLRSKGYSLEDMRKAFEAGLYCDSSIEESELEFNDLIANLK